MKTTFKAGEIAALQTQLFERLIALLESKNYTGKVEELRDRLKKLESQEKIRVAFVGQYSAGKSSMISALTGQQVAIGTDVTTDESTDYQWGSFLLTDTPGLQNNQTHDAIAAEAIKNSDLIVYCLTYELFNRNTLADYLNLAYEKGYKDKMILVINKINSEECDDQEALIANYIESLNKTLAPHSLSDVPYCFIDALDYMKGIEKNKERRIAKSRFLNFIEILNEYLCKNGQIYKMDTPLRMASAIVDEVRIDESESDEQRQQKIVISRLNREFKILRSEAGRKWNVEVSRELSDFSENAYALFEQIESGSCENPQEAFDKLLGEAIDSVNSTLTKFSEDYEAECGDKAREVLSSGVSRKLFGDINVEAHETVAQMSSAECEKSSSGKILDIGKTLAEYGGKVTQEGAKKAILNIGHAFKHKFKPWGATKLASKATTFLKCLGPIMEVYSFISDIKDTEKENDEARQRKKARADFYALLDDTKNTIRSV
ncbi:MAG: 50S ribosome-binding GTPase, partial [Clostridia bacterium]|nr:50S ribosome-binding GTPase [Clostridia bacterium]